MAFQRVTTQLSWFHVFKAFVLSEERMWGGNICFNCYLLPLHLWGSPDTKSIGSSRSSSLRSCLSTYFKPDEKWIVLQTIVNVHVGFVIVYIVPWIWSKNFLEDVFDCHTTVIVPIPSGFWKWSCLEKGVPAEAVSAWLTSAFGAVAGGGQPHTCAERGWLHVETCTIELSCVSLPLMEKFISLCERHNWKMWLFSFGQSSILLPRVTKNSLQA